MQQLNQSMEGKNNDLTETIAQALNEIKLCAFIEFFSECYYIICDV